jgi:hypothetical protein
MNRHNLYQMQFGTNLDKQPDGYGVRGVRIDNLSNSWLFVDMEVRRYVPPLTIGWTATCPVAQNRTMVSFIDGPSGGITSSQSGGAISVWTYDEPVADSEGTSFGSVTNQSQSQQIIVSPLSFTSSSGLLVHVATVPNKRIVVMSWTVAATDGPDGFADDALVNEHHIQLFSNMGLHMTLSPTKPWGFISLYPYGIATVPNDGVYLTATSNDPEASDRFLSLIRYYVSEP